MESSKFRHEGANMTYEGLIPKNQKSKLSKDRDSMQPHIRAFVDRAVTFIICPECEGTRLDEHARTSRIEGVSIVDAGSMQITSLPGRVPGLGTQQDSGQVARILANPSGLLTPIPQD